MMAITKYESKTQAGRKPSTVGNYVFNLAVFPTIAFNTAVGFLRKTPVFHHLPE